MNLIVVSKFTQVIQPSRHGEIIALVVPTLEQTTVLKNLSINSTSEVAERNGINNKKIFWRSEGGLTYTYGEVPAEITQLRQAVEAYLPEDLLPAETTAYFYLLNENWIIHGIQSYNEENHKTWRSTLLRAKPEHHSAKLLAEGLGDLLLMQGQDKIIVAWHKAAEKILPDIEEILAIYKIQAFPMISLKKNIKKKPLYRHGDYHIVQITMVFISFIVLLATITLWILNYFEEKNINKEIKVLQEQISSIELNKRLQQIRNPEAFLNAIDTPLKQQPSSLIDAAAQFAKEMGDLTSVNLRFGSDSLSPGSNQSKIDSDGTILVELVLAKPRYELLVQQESSAKKIIEQLPWIRSVESVGSAGQSKINLRLQAEALENSSIIKNTN